MATSVAAASIALVALLLLNFLAYNHARSMTRFVPSGTKTAPANELSFSDKLKVLFQGITLPRPTSELTPIHAGLHFDSHWIQCNDGPKLAAWHCPHERPAAIVILLHGYAAEKSALISAAAAYRQLGFATLLMDFRGSGFSSENYTTIGVREALDVEAAFEYARKQLGYENIVLHGQSMGAAALLRAIHVHNIAPAAIVVEAVFDSLLTTTKNRFKQMGLPSFPGAHLLVFWGGRQHGFKGLTHCPSAYARSVKCPALFLHGKDDPLARLEEARQVFEAITSRKAFQEFTVGHDDCQSAQPELWLETLQRFFNENLKRSTS